MKMDKNTGKDLIKVKSYTKYIYGMIIVIVLLDQLIKIILSCIILLPLLFSILYLFFDNIFFDRKIYL